MAKPADVHPTEANLRIQLIRAIRREFEARDMGTPTKAAALLGTNRSNVSPVFNEHADRTTLRQLLQWADKLDLHFTLSAEVAPSR